MSKQKILNLINHLKQTKIAYNGKLYESGYHTITLDGQTYQGQRNNNIRFENIPFDFHGKTILDLGCHIGDTLQHFAVQIKYGIGIDKNTNYINTANAISNFKETPNIHFYTFDLETEKLEFINNFFLEPNIDICFLLSICNWITNWKKVIDFCYNNSEHLLFESNGKELQQKDQIQYLKSKYKTIQIINNESLDDPRQHNRKLIICKR